MSLLSAVTTIRERRAFLGGEGRGAANEFSDLLLQSPALQLRFGLEPLDQAVIKIESNVSHRGLQVDQE